MQTVKFDAFTGKNRLRLGISGDVSRGEVTRSEGGIAMTLVDPVLSVECEGVDFASIHPDVLALIGVLAFFPVLPETDFELRTSFPVSANLQAALRRPWILPGVSVSGNGVAGPYFPKVDTVISYGGGLDSLAASILFPGIPLVHETPLPTSTAAYTDVVNAILRRQPENWVVFDNLRQLFSAWGLPLWVAAYISSLIVEPRNIISGTEMTGTYLSGGVGYKPRNANVWYRVFQTIGVNILPTSFLTEIGNARIVMAGGRMNDAAYCVKIDVQDCNRCTKCLRRRLIRAMLNPEETVMVDEFLRSESIMEFLATRPLYYGDVFIHAAGSTARPTWVNEHIADLIEAHGSLAFHDAYYPDAFEHFGYPDELRKMAEEGMAAVGIPSFDAATRKQFETYSQL
ncbi:DUF6395 domain-containing protein [Arthrobacter sp. 260]|uniref:DUF6395 domain-containing protein n=1 Tax=Arthrobacter sp. 260 TaxID=2735314 RepID=UPI001492EE14|nr:DUF6395 domain-containing protein [Arthrobacter sp. 260]NOJ61420.1 hypothetical protein [Arthrobacter sp. 260]